MTRMVSHNRQLDAVRLRISLSDMEPAPWREVEVPLSMSFKTLHFVIQAAFLWEDAHLWEFDLGNRRYGIPDEDEAFFAKMFGGSGPRTANAVSAKLNILSKHAVTEFYYTYDFGDNWVHRVEVLDYTTETPEEVLPRFLDGEWRCPPEDVGGPDGFYYFLEALADPDHEEHEHTRQWYGQDFDQQNLEKPFINVRMKQIAKRRRKKPT